MKYVSKFLLNKFDRYLSEDIYSIGSQGSGSLGAYGERVKHDVKDAQGIGRSATSQRLSKKLKINRKTAAEDSLHRVGLAADPDYKKDQDSQNKSNRERRRFENKTKARKGTLSSTITSLMSESILYFDDISFTKYIYENKDGKNLLRFLMKERLTSKYSGSLYEFIKDNIDSINKKLEEEYYAS